ncbi:UdgX family uracil-DNA binding protein [Vannielia litorea]|uniref:UdgX family uracil-DNA binding protein n=1 Tax=Vannielia litorea TaxID=1217970 RepID=UPI001C9382A0|nr:UdgX family uracil-DNA binding protein [Vannielia litorea]MBY6151746.1 UdgX family uracil-DNA binding protein [Vannielia litorea]
MLTVRLPKIGSVAAWRSEARKLAAEGIGAEHVRWTQDSEQDLFASDDAPHGAPVEVRLSKQALFDIESSLYHRDPERFARAYALVLRLGRGEIRWGERADDALRKLLHQRKEVGRDIHKMHAFVRFNEVTEPGANRRAFAAWFEPDNPITEAAAPFFARRFGDMDWVIATPDLTARFIAGQLSFDETGANARLPEDASHELWRTYYANIFNPARLMPEAMRSEMPKKYWKNLPEARLIPDLIRTAPARAAEMHAKMPSIPPAFAAKAVATRAPMPEGVTHETFKQHLDACTRCPIGCRATQAVAGEGPWTAPLMVVGEQPGDAEDLSGQPFVGPAGQLFDTCAAKAGLEREKVYVTNAVKHFKFTPRGKRRIHQRPDAGEVEICSWWLDLERQWVKPRLLLAMGATAALALTGSAKNITARRGTVEATKDGTPVLLTTHPSYLLRLPDQQARVIAEAQFTEDLRAAKAMLA